VRHPQFEAERLHNDIALLKLDEAADSKIPLGRYNTDNAVPVEKESVTVVGFGSFSEEEFDPSRTLQQVELKTS
jgi:hypothetical protein